MTIAAIWAQDLSGGIGLNGALPWRHKPDVEHFWKTIGEDTVIVGNSTWTKNIGLFFKRRASGKYIVLSNHAHSALCSGSKPQVKYVSNIGSALNLLKDWEGNAWVTGGAKTYALFASVIDVFVMTKIYNRYTCDTFMPWGLTPPNATAWDFYDLKPNAEGVEARVGIYVSNRIKDPERVVNNMLRRDLEWEL